jgi:hypothetical protein
MMNLGKWALGMLAASLYLGSAQAAPIPLSSAPGGTAWDIESVQFDYGPPRDPYDSPRRERYDEPRRDRYDDPRGDRYGGRPYRREYEGYEQRRSDYGPRPGYRDAPPPREALRPIPRRPAGPPTFYTKEQVREWNRRNGL